MVSGPANIKGHHTLLLDMDKYHKSKKEIWMVAVSWVYIKIDDMYNKKAKISQISSFSSLKPFNISELLQTRIQSRKYLVFGCAMSAVQLNFDWNGLS